MTGWLVRLGIREGGDTGDPAVRRRCGMLSGVVGILLNTLLCAGKFFAGAATGSISMTADAINNLTDAASSAVTLVGFRLAGQQEDDRHPFGHGRIEYLTGLVVALMILVVGVELGKTSIQKILAPEETTFSAASAVILAAAIGVKLWMYGFNRALGRRIRSAAMKATATDCLADAAATAAVLAGTLVWRLAGVNIDGWIGLVVTAFILRAGWGAARDTLNPLLGARPDPALVKDIRDTVMSHPQVMGMHDLMIHDYGPGRTHMSFHAEVPLTADIMEAHDAIDHIERELHARFGIETSIHMDPVAVDDERTCRVRRQVEELVDAVVPGMTVHDFRLIPRSMREDLIFDVAVPRGCRLSDAQVRERISRAVRALDERYRVVLQIDRVYVDTP